MFLSECVISQRNNQAFLTVCTNPAKSDQKLKSKSTHHVLREPWFSVFQELVKHLHLMLDPD